MGEKWAGESSPKPRAEAAKLEWLKKREGGGDQVGAGLPATESRLQDETDEHMAENIPH